MTELLVILLAVIPVALILFYVYTKDKNKEPTGLLVLLFLGGIFSCFLVLVVSQLLSQIFPFMNITIPSENNTFLDVFLYSFVGVALIEELCKFLMVYAIGYRHKAFDEIYDMLAYAIFVALGFAGFENIIYLFTNETVDAAVKLGISRGLTAIPGHACDGLFMGYFLSLAKVSAKRKNKIEERNNILKSIFIPTVLHGIYDFCCFAGNNILSIFFVVFIIVLDIIAIKRINYISKNNRSINEKPKRDIISEIIKIKEPSEIETIQSSVTDEANNYNQHSNKDNSEYFTIAPYSPKPTADWHNDSFKFENSSVPYIPEIYPQQGIDYAPLISKEQSADYVPILPDDTEIQGIPEIPSSELPEPPKNFCVYCGAKLKGNYCPSCGHEIK